MTTQVNFGIKYDMYIDLGPQWDIINGYMGGEKDNKKANID
jgi:hypothetical protein